MANLYPWLNRAIPPWHSQAKCAHSDLPPQTWDALPAGGPRPQGARAQAEHHLHAAMLCAGCPVLAECAAEALAATYTNGVIRAGIPLSRPRLQRDTWQAEALGLIADGAEPLAAVTTSAPAALASTLAELVEVGA